MGELKNVAEFSSKVVLGVAIESLLGLGIAGCVLLHSVCG